jgi:hypothetical protein
VWVFPWWLLQFLLSDCPVSFWFAHLLPKSVDFGFCITPSSAATAAAAQLLLFILLTDAVRMICYAALCCAARRDAAVACCSCQFIMLERLGFASRLSLRVCCVPPVYITFANRVILPFELDFLP